MTGTSDGKATAVVPNQALQTGKGNLSCLLPFAFAKATPARVCR